MATEIEEVKEKKQVEGKQIAMVVGGALLLLALFWFFFLRGGDPAEEVAAPPPDPAITTPGDLDGDKGGKGGDKDDKPPVETFEVFASRDPFEPLLSTEGEGGTTDDGTTDDGTTDDGTTDDGTTDPPTDTDGDGDIDDDDATDPGDSGDGDGPGGESVEGHTVQLVSVNGQGKATVQVDGTVYEVTQGETFAENFELLSTSGDCATMLFGDDQFTVCEGEEILK